MKEERSKEMIIKLIDTLAEEMEDDTELKNFLVEELGFTNNELESLGIDFDLTESYNINQFSYDYK